MKADRKNAWLPAWVDHQSAYISFGDFLPSGRGNSTESKVYNEPIYTLMVCHYSTAITLCINIYLIIHPSIFVRLSGAGSRGQLPVQGHPDFPLPGHFPQLFREDPKAFSGQLGNIVTPACPGSSSGSPPKGSILEASETDARATSAGSSRCGGAAALLRAPPGWQSSSPYL